jgi:hypothetical protein
MLSCSRHGAAVGVAPSTASRLHRSRVERVGIGDMRGLLLDDVYVVMPVKALALEHDVPGYYTQAR